MLVLGIAISCGILFAESTPEPVCPMFCTCMVPTGETKPCTEGVTRCSGVTAVKEFDEEENEEVWRCGDAEHVKTGWIKGCTLSTYSVDTHREEAHYDFESNCNLKLEHCKHPMSCNPVPNSGPGPPVKCQNGAQNGPWVDYSMISWDPC